MTTPGPGVDLTAAEPHRVLGGAGILARWNAAGVLAAADVHVTDRLTRMCGEPLSDLALLGTALAVRAVRLGSTCLALDRIGDIPGLPDQPDLVPPAPAEMLSELRRCPLVVGTGAGPLRPLMLMSSDDGPLLYLQKYFRQEETIRTVLAARAATSPQVDPDRLRSAIDTVFGDVTSSETVDLQRLAAAVVASRWTTVLAGGPGTGKTYTVARILAVLQIVHGGSLRVGLCAPTGRAAAQLQASVSPGGSAGLDPTLITGAGALHAVTVHSLLGWYPGSNPRFGRGHTLPHDVIVVDETSMLSMTAMSRVLDAARPDARVIFVGDPHQLASVDAGAVLADLVERTDTDPGPAAGESAHASIALQAAGIGPERVSAEAIGPGEAARISRGVITLRREYRFGGGIAAVAAAVNAGDATRVIDLLTDPDVSDIELIAPDDIDATRPDVTAWGRELRTAALACDAHAAVEALDSHRVLCAHREGYWGVRGWSRRVAEWLGRDADRPGWFAGQPILVTANDRQTRTFNGDTGVIIRDPHSGDPDDLRVAFRRGGEVRLLRPTQLAEISTVYAMTIHRSQGSQFDRVTVVLPPSGSELLTRELLYTAITRARTAVRVVAAPDVVRAAVERRVQRASGLRSPVTPFAPR